MAVSCSASNTSGSVWNSSSSDDRCNGGGMTSPTPSTLLPHLTNPLPAPPQSRPPHQQNEDCTSGLESSPRDHTTTSLHHQHHHGNHQQQQHHQSQSQQQQQQQHSDAKQLN